MKQISRKYTNTSIIGRVVVIIVAIVIIVIMIATTNSGQQPEDICEYIDAKGAETLALRDWMTENGLDSISLMNKSNRNDGKGVSIQVGKLYCFFEGHGTDVLFGTVDFDGISNVTDKAFDLEKIAKEYGAYAYLRHENIFEIIISGDPITRLRGMEGTSVFYSKQPIKETEVQTEVSSVEDLGNGWFIAKANGQPIYNEQINIKSELFRAIAIVIALSSFY